MVANHNHGYVFFEMFGPWLLLAIYGFYQTAIRKKPLPAIVRVPWKLFKFLLAVMTLGVLAG